MRFLFIVQVMEKVQKKAQFSFCVQRKVFIMKLFFEEFNIVFFKVDHLTCFEMQPRHVMENFEVHFLLYDQGNYFFKSKFMYL